MKKFLLSFLCFLMAVASGFAEEVTDVLNRSTTGVTGTTYTSWSGKKLNTAVYAGQSAGGNESIQLRSSNSNSGIVSTTSGGKVKKVTVVWHPNTASDRTLNVYGSNSAFTSPTDLYNDSKKGDLLGTIVCGTSTVLEVKGDYAYIGLRSKSAAMYLTSVSITWETSGSGGEASQIPAMPTLSKTTNFIGSMEVAMSCTTEDAAIYYTTDGSEPTSSSEKYSVPFEITETMTIKAIAINTAGSSSVVTETYTRVAESPTITYDSEANPVIVTINAAEGTTAYYTLNGKDPNKGSDECPKTLTLKADATLKVVAYDEDNYASLVTEQVIKLPTTGSEGSATKTATLVTDAGTLNAGDQVVVVAAEYDYALSVAQNDNNRGRVAITKKDNLVTLNDDVQILTLTKSNNNFEFYTGAGYLYAASSTKNYLRTQSKNDKNGRWTIDILNGVATIKTVGENTRNVLMYNYQSSIFSCYSSGQKDVSLYKVNLSSIEDYVLNVTAAGWSTLFLGYNVVIPDDVTCYVISSVGDDNVQLEEVNSNVIPANTAVIVEAEEGDYTFAVTKETASIESCMVGSTKNEYITKEAYVLANGQDGVGLYKAEMNGGVFLNNANKAYLPATAVTSNVKALKFDFNTTAVENVKVETEGKKVIYDLSGRRANDMTAPGLYIVNGKKVMVK